MLTLLYRTRALYIYSIRDSFDKIWGGWNDMATLGSSNGNGKQSFCATSFKLALEGGWMRRKALDLWGSCNPLELVRMGKAGHKSSNSLLTGCCIYTLEAVVVELCLSWSVAFRKRNVPRPQEPHSGCVQVGKTFGELNLTQSSRELRDATAFPLF